LLSRLLNISAGKVDILLLQEPFYRNISIVSYPNFLSILPHTTARVPRTVAYLSKLNTYLKVTTRPDLSDDSDLQVLDFSTPTIPTIRLFNIYNEVLPRNHSTPRTIERNLLNLQLPDRCLLTSEINTYHPWWNSAKSPLGADTLIQIMQQKDFSLLNELDVSTYHSRCGRFHTVIDLTFTSPSITNNFLNGLNSISEAFRTTSTEAMEAEAVLPPTTVRLNCICRRYANRVATLPANHHLQIRYPDTIYLFIHHTACSLVAIAKVKGKLIEICRTRLLLNQSNPT
jgi:hypothetical protein